MDELGGADESDAAKLPQVQTQADRIHELVVNLKVAMIEELRKLEERKRPRWPFTRK
jgi:hypothetical protein